MSWVRIRIRETWWIRFRKKSSRNTAFQKCVIGLHLNSFIFFFSMDLLRRVAPGLSDEGSKDDHLVVVVVRGGWGEGGPAQGQLGTQGEGTFYSCQGPLVDQSPGAAGRYGQPPAAIIDPQWRPADLPSMGPPFSVPSEDASGRDMSAQFSQLNLQWF
jgi:hypothetical protein